MSCAADLNELIKDINKKFRHQRQVHEQEKREWALKSESMEKRLKERNDEAAALREQLLTVKKRNLELEKALADQNSIIQRMHSKLQTSFDSTFNGSTHSEGAGDRRRSAVKVRSEDKCVSTDDWHTILEKELTERIERFAAFVNGKKDSREESRISGRLSDGLEFLNGSTSGRQRSGNTSTVDRSSATGQQRNGNMSMADRSLSKIDENGDGYAAARSSMSNSRFSLRGNRSILENGISDHQPLIPPAAQGTSTPATSVWHVSTPLSNRHYSQNDRDHSLPFDDTLRDLPNNLDTSALADDLMQKFSELEIEAQALFDMDDFGDAENGATSKISSIVSDV